MNPRALFALLPVVLALLSGCAANPVTGQQELAFVSESEEIAIGKEQYAPSRQSQGGDYQVDPVLTRYVDKVGQKLAAVSDRKLPYEFTVLNNSVPNAWALPGGKIAVNRGLLTELHNEAELAAVLGHEIVHAAARHGAQGMERGIFLQGAVLAVGVAVAASDDYGDYADLAAGVATVGAGMVNQRYSREAELEADLYGMEYMVRAGYDPMAAVALQETFVRLSEGQEENWLEGLFASHPPSRERVDRNRETAARLRSKGGVTLGEEPFQRAVAHLIETKDAYAAFDEGQAALEKGDAAKALKLADKALAVEPKEALFYGLKGDALTKQGQYRQALNEYDRALSRDGGYFDYYLKRGLVKAELDDGRGARTDLERSVSLLPTAEGHFALGRLALATGDRGSAAQHFLLVADSDSPLGKQAAKELERIGTGSTSGTSKKSQGSDASAAAVAAESPRKVSRPAENAVAAIPATTGERNLADQLRAVVSQEGDGNLVILVRNGGKQSLGRVQVQMEKRDDDGNIKESWKFRYRDAIAPGETVRIETEVAGPEKRRNLRKFQVEVVEARAGGA